MQTRVGNHVIVERKQGDKGNAWSFTNDENKRRKETQLSFHALKPKTQNNWKSSFKGNLSEAAVLLERDPKRLTVSLTRSRRKLVVKVLLKNSKPLEPPRSKTNLRARCTA